MGLVVAVLSGFALALVAPSLATMLGRAAGWIFALLPAGLALYFAGQLETIAEHGSATVALPWVPSLDIQFSFLLDGLSLLFGLIITGVGALILIYTGGYLAGHPQVGRFYAILLAFMGSMLGVVLADNVLTLFVFWELTSLTSYFLIGFDHERPAARAAALQALLVTGGGGLALLAGLLILGQVGGSLELSALLAAPGGVRDSLSGQGMYLPVQLLILLGAFTKSAQFPFHFWLPGAMEAPTPVSAYLHSATMVKAGVYLLARLSPILGETELWFYTVGIAGTSTLLVGSYLAVVQTDLKRILAYSTVGALGLLVMLLGMGTEVAVRAAVLFLLAHALYKGTLFLVAGAVDHETGARDASRLSGLGRAMPATAFAAGLAALSMAALPPLFGYLAKEEVYAAVLGLEVIWPLIAAVAGSVPFVAVALMVGIRPFVGASASTPAEPHEPPASLLVGPILLASLGALFGVWSAPLAEMVFGPAVSAVLGRPTAVKLAVWHGFSLALALSVATIGLGVCLFLLRNRLREAASAWPALGSLGPAAWYQWGLAGLNRLAAGQTRILQSGYLRYYLLIVLVAAMSFIVYPLAAQAALLSAWDWSGIRFYEWGLVSLVLAAAAATVLFRSRLTAIASLGVVGYGVAILFSFFGAPDLAMTQFLIETLTLVLFVLVFYHVPETAALSSLSARGRDVLFALGFGTMMTALVLAAADVQLAEPISAEYLQRSDREAHGRNVVNVILVDFRGLDTLGEITVLAAAAIGVYALLKLRPTASTR